MSEASATFVAYLSKRRPLVERWIEEHAWVPSGSGADDLTRYLYGPLSRFNAGAGKRVRPVLTLLGCEAVGGNPEQALAAGCAVELFQSAALIHDDIADASTTRRGEPCMHLAEGLGIAVNAGDGALVQASEALLAEESLAPEVRLALMHEMLEMQRRTLEGQALDLGWTRDGRWDLTPEDYFLMASSKTAYYSASAPLVLGATCAGASEEQIGALRSFGMDAGLAFQIADDLLNLVGDAEAQGKDFRSDITEGKRTLIATWALAQLDAPAADELRSLLAGHVTDAASLDRAIELMEGCGSLEHALQVANELVDNAVARLDSVELDGEAHEALVSMAHFFVERAS